MWLWGGISVSWAPALCMPVVMPLPPVVFLSSIAAHQEAKGRVTWGNSTGNKGKWGCLESVLICRPDFKLWLCLLAAVKLRKMWPRWASLFSPTQGKPWSVQKRKSYFFFSYRLSAWLSPKLSTTHERSFSSNGSRTGGFNMPFGY